MALSLAEAVHGRRSVRAASADLGSPERLSLRMLAATAAIDDRYAAEGGRLGFLGHPVTPFGLNDAGLPQRTFEGGDLQVTDTGEAVNTVRWQTTVRYKGIHCFGETAGLGSDEPYVVVMAYAASKREKAVVTRFGPYSDVDDGTTRVDIQDVWTDQPPTDLVVCSMVVEHDDGDPDDVVNEVRDALARAADALDAADSAGKWLNDFLGSEFFGDILGAVGGVLGLGDDPIGAESFVVTYPDSVGLFDTPRPVQQVGNLRYTHETPLISDGDASYKAYFDVFTDKIITGQRPPER